MKKYTAQIKNMIKLSSELTSLSTILSSFSLYFRTMLIKSDILILSLLIKLQPYLFLMWKLSLVLIISSWQARSTDMKELEGLFRWNWLMRSEEVMLREETSSIVLKNSKKSQCRIRSDMLLMMRFKDGSINYYFSMQLNLYLWKATGCPIQTSVNFILSIVIHCSATKEIVKNSCLI